MPDSQTARDLLQYATTPGAARVLISTLDLDAPTSTYYDDSFRQCGRLDGVTSAKLWKNGRVSAAAAEKIALLSGDGAFLAQMAVKETRVGVQKNLVMNPALPYAALLPLHQKLGWKSPLQVEALIQRCHQEELTEELFRTVTLSRCTTSQSAYATHPQHTTQSLIDLVTLRHDSWKGFVYHRPDLLERPELLEVLGRLEGGRIGISGLLDRDDLQHAPHWVIEIIIKATRGAGIAHVPGLTPAHYESMIEHPERTRGGYMEYGFWRALAENPSVPSHLLHRAPYTSSTLPVLGRLMQESHPDNESAWEMLLGLLPTAQGRSCGEIMETIENLLG